jgi:dolichol-phosphate mannosyltransferase
MAPVRLSVRTPNVFVVPAYDEERNLPRLLSDLAARPALFPAKSRVIIVDDGSTDATAAVAESYAGTLPVEVVRLPENRGPGAAFRAGFALALAQVPGEALIVTLEADNTADLDALPKLLAQARFGADLVLAAWVMENVSWFRRALSNGAGVVVRRVLGLDAHTVSSFFRVYRASCLRAGYARFGDDLIRERGFACKAELLAKLASLDAVIVEIPVGLDTSRRVGESKMPVVRTILGYWRMMARQRFHRVAA